MLGWSVAVGAECDSLAAAHWLLGTWEASTSRSTTVETWRRASANTFEGIGEQRSTESGKTTGSESLRLVAMAGGVFYLAKVAHNPWPVPFRMVVCDDDRLVFENTGHDFPTRLDYRRVGDTGLAVEVTGPDGDGFTLRFEKAPEADGSGQSP